MKLITLLVLTILLVTVDGKRKRKSSKKDKVFQYSAAGPFFSLPVTVGSQRTKLSVGIDGFYGATVIYCPNAGSPAGGFSHRSSSTWKPAVPNRHFDFSLGTGQGDSGSDYLRVGSLPAMKSEMFGNPETVSSNAISKLPQASGFLAMWGPQDDPMQKTTMQLVAESAKKAKITFHAPHNLDGTHTITIGKEDKTNCKSNWLVLNNVASLDKNERPWTVEFDGFKWGSYNKPQKTAVAFNVAADYFVAPKAHANHIYKSLKAKYSSRYYGGLVSCSKLKSAPTIEFMVKGKKLSIKPTQYIKQFNRATCLLNIYPDDLNMWTMPYNFHQGRCVKYDYSTKTLNIADQM
ncbi:hypothetical protein M3Y94_00897800 [Aphelenchoides besseyi]|nr:hypothetical protein M3Y94_00897800 [Aphelenchoides besseyi]KAI6223381.1 hypothetical protein M3Y95_00884200 [Aphelenchoides besseyi]